jgi:hypothetical protein
VAAVLLPVTLAGCRGAEDAAPTDAAQERAAETVPADVNDTPQDSVIFAQTMAWVAQSGLDTLDVARLMAAIGRRFVGEPYTPYTLEAEGAERLVVNLREFDCVTFIEQSLAMARTVKSGTVTYAEFRDQLRGIRYRDGALAGYPSRLHYFSEWIANNDDKGIVRDVTRDLGGVEDAEPITFMTAHRDAYRQLADSANYEAIRAVEARLGDVQRFYIPETGIADVADRILEGDIIAATSTEPGLDIAHTGIAVRIDGRLHLMHAPLVGSVVEISEVPLADRILDIRGQDGILVARPQ